MASKENNIITATGAVMQTYQAQINMLKLENKKLSDENHSLRIKMAADGKKLVLVREWITHFNELSDHLKEIAKDWEENPSVQKENKTNASNQVIKMNEEPRPLGSGLRVMLNRTKQTPRWPKTPTEIVHNSMLGRLQKNLQDQEMNNAVQAPGPSSSIGHDFLNVEIKTEVDDEAEVIIVAPVETSPKKLSTTTVVSVQTQQKVEEKTAKKRKIPEKPKVRQTRSQAKANNIEEPTEKRYCLVTPVPVLKKDGDDNGGLAISRSKSDGGKTAKRLMTKRSSNH